MTIELNIFLFIIVGFVAQMIDGALGMAYGVSSSTFLLSIGIPPVTASASVHTAEVFTTAVSGFSHWKLGNVDKRLFAQLVLPGVVGAVVGAYVLTTLPADTIKPLVAAYLLIMGVRILIKAFRKIEPRDDYGNWCIPLGIVGGFFDAIGGGGWGPIVTSTLVARGNHPRTTIGSVNLAEFFVTTAQAVTFILTIGLVHWQVIVGLMIGGVIAAPLAAVVTRKVPVKTLMIIVGILIIALSIRTITLALV